MYSNAVFTVPCHVVYITLLGVRCSVLMDVLFGFLVSNMAF